MFQKRIEGNTALRSELGVLADSGEGRLRRLRTGFQALQSSTRSRPSPEGAPRSPSTESLALQRALGLWRSACPGALGLRVGGPWGCRII